MPSDKILKETWTILKLLLWTEGYFSSYNIDSPRLTAEILLCHALNIRRIDLYLQFDRPLNKGELSTYKSFIKRRVRREPVEYITGIKGFWESQFTVNSEVLIPRPDTEILVEASLVEIEQKRKKKKENNFKVLELGTGSGAIAISLAKANPDIYFFATDISLRAAIVAKQNSVNEASSLAPPSLDVSMNDLSVYREKLYLPNLSFLVGSWFSPIKCGTKFDLIISNPPYIPTGDIDTLQEEVKDYEPRLALDGGQDGLSCLREIMLSTPNYLLSGGVLLMEIGFDQWQRVEHEVALISKYEEATFMKDYAGHNRVVHLKKR